MPTSISLLFADSGPLIALARLDLLALPGHYFASVLLPQTVWQEVTRNALEPERSRLLTARETACFSVVADPMTIPETLATAGLDLGERNAIALALSSSAELLIDERRGRRVAKVLDLTVTGTLGLLLRAKQDGLIPSLTQTVQHLNATGYFLAPALVAQILSAAGEEP